MFSVGGRYGEGKGVSQDYAKALSWLQKAKENGWTEAEGGTGLIDEMIAFLEKELPDNGVQEEIRKMSQDSTSGSILENEKVLSILKVVEKEIFENFMFQPGLPRWITKLMTCLGDSAIRINAIHTS